MPIVILSGLLVLGSLLSPVLTQKDIHWPRSSAQAEKMIIIEQPPLDLAAEGVYVSDANTQEMLVEYREDKTWSIASLTKLMTALVFLEENPDLDQLIAMEKDDFTEGATLEVPIGTKMKALDVLKASLMSSANNSTNALVRGTGLTKDEFVTKMNQKAKAWGLTHTYFVEPTGLDPANVSTPQEYSKILAAAFENPLIAEIMSETYHEISSSNYPTFAIGTTNKLLKEEQQFDVLGGKTGFTYGSDYNFAAKLKEGDKEVLVVVFGDKTMNDAFESARKLGEETLEEPVNQ